MRLVVLCITFLSVVCAAPLNDENVVNIPGLGRVVGSLIAQGNVVQFLGIPYAAAPIGVRRFAPPEKVEAWSGTLSAKIARPGCPQNCTMMKSACPEEMSEDCLFLNIWMPTRKALANSHIRSKPKSSGHVSTSSMIQSYEDAYIPLNLLQTDPPHTHLLPVYAFIHGGMFTEAHAATPLINATHLASSGIVVVTFNYRLGALGFLATGGNELPGNFGILDQMHALQFIQEHISAFSGDPHAVTLGGQSAGANSVAIHLTSERSRGMFHQAILESAVLGLPYFTQSQAEYEVGADLIYRLGCSDKKAEMLLECLRNVSVGDIVDAQSASTPRVSSVRKLFGSPYFSSLVLPWAPVLSPLIPDQPLNLLRSGKHNHVPVIAGFTKDEFASFTPELVPELGKYSYSALVYAYFGLHVSSQILTKYPASDTISDQRNVLSDITRDMFVACPLRSISMNNTFPAFLYRFDHVFTDSRLWAEYSSYCSRYACHSSELAAVFMGKGAANLTEGSLTPAEEIGADQLHRYFVRFIKSGDPNDMIVDFPWPPSNGVGPYLRVELPFSLIPEGLDGQKCDMWDEIGYFW